MVSLMDYLMLFASKSLIFILVLSVGVLFLSLDRNGKKKMVVMAAVLFPLAFIVARIGSNIYFSPRPFVTYNFVPLLAHAADNGFPSDHALFAFSLAFFGLIFNKRAGYTFLIIALIIGVSRIYVGVHSPIDIIGSAVIGGTAAFCTNYLYKKYLIRYVDLKIFK